MATVNVALSDQMKGWAEECVQSGRYVSVSDYVRDLIRKDKERDVALEQVQQMISEGIESGVSDKSVDDVWGRLKARRTNG